MDFRILWIWQGQRTGMARRHAGLARVAHSAVGRRRLEATATAAQWQLRWLHKGGGGGSTRAAAATAAIMGDAARGGSSNCRNDGGSSGT